jgi:hypothetical protein
VAICVNPGLLSVSVILGDGTPAGWMIFAMPGVITASEPSWIAPFAALSPRCFTKLVTALRREGADETRRGHP